MGFLGGIVNIVKKPFDVVGNTVQHVVDRVTDPIGTVKDVFIDIPKNVICNPIATATALPGAIWKGPSAQWQVLTGEDRDEKGGAKTATAEEIQAQDAQLRAERQGGGTGEGAVASTEAGESGPVTAATVQAEWAELTAARGAGPADATSFSASGLTSPAVQTGPGVFAPQTPIDVQALLRAASYRRG